MVPLVFPHFIWFIVNIDSVKNSLSINVFMLAKHSCYLVLLMLIILFG